MASRQTIFLSVLLWLAAFAHSKVLRSAARPSGFVLYKQDNLAASAGDACVKAITAKIDCDTFILQFRVPGYHGSLEKGVTDSICTSNCAASLKSWFDSVSVQCEADALNDGSLPVLYGGYIWSAYNETCIRDPKTKRYCNDIIEEFQDVETMEDLPKNELCHVCNVRRLAIMQSSQFSVYNEMYKQQLEYVHSKCGLKGPTEIPPPIEVPKPEPVPFCVTGKYYTTQDGDTCDSIATAQGVSAAMLFFGNQNKLQNCQYVPGGESVCLPLPCTLYAVQSQDTCDAIEAALGLHRGDLRKWNSWIDYGCLNLKKGTATYGKNICVSPQGGRYTPTSIPPQPTHTSTGDGYADKVIDPPSGAELAKGTTLRCGKWHVVEAGDQCVDICLRNGITAGLFREVNPSLSAEPCTKSLKKGTALCVGPTRNWDLASSSSVTPTATVTATPATGSTSN